MAVAEYNKAIHFVNDFILKNENARSLSTILITCVLFVVLELYGGCVDKAIMHLNEGRKLLLLLGRRQNYILTGASSTDEALYFAARPESVEDKLINMFAHMDLQAAYFGSERPQLKLSAYENETNGTKPPSIAFDPSLLIDIPARFRSLHEANQHLVILTNECLRFTGHTFDQTKHTIRNHVSNCHRRCLSSCLRRWREAYSEPCFTITQLEKEEISWKSQSALMLVQHAWLTIIIATSYLEVEETELDCLIDYFTTIVNSTAFVFSPEGEGTSANRKHFALELGIVPPLWWTAMKCRHPKIRRKALWLLGQVGSEGFWDPMIMRQIGIETLVLEEEPRYNLIEADSWISMDQDASFHGNMDLGAFVPLRRRISGATASSVDNDKQTLYMTFKRKLRDDEGLWTGEFDLITVERPLESFAK